MLQTIIISAIFGLLGGIFATYFRSLFHIKEKKIELIFDFRKVIYSDLHKLTFLTDSFAEARYGWQIYGTEGRVLDQSVYDKLENMTFEQI